MFRIRVWSYIIFRVSHNQSEAFRVFCYAELNVLMHMVYKTAAAYRV